MLLKVTIGTTALVSLSTISSYAMESTQFKLNATFNSEEMKQKENWIKFFDEETGKEVLIDTDTDTVVYEVYEIVNGNRVKLNIDDALKKFNLNEEFEVNAAKSIFTISNKRKFTGAEQKLSHDIHGGELGATISVGDTITVGESFTLGGTTEPIKEVVRANAGFTWNKSLSRTVTTTHKIPPHETRYVAFKPYYMEVKGEVNGMIAGTPIIEKIEATSPIKVGNICDGLEYLAKSKGE